MKKSTTETPSHSSAFSVPALPCPRGEAVFHGWSRKAAEDLIRTLGRNADQHATRLARGTAIEAAPAGGPDAGGKP
jgi:hypothetical protein